MLRDARIAVFRAPRPQVLQEKAELVKTRSVALESAVSAGVKINLAQVRRS